MTGGGFIRRTNPDGYFLAGAGTARNSATTFLSLVEFQLRTFDRIAVHLVEHLHESILVLHVGAGHPGHAQVSERQLLSFQLVFAEETVAVGASGHHRIGSVEFQGEEIGLGGDGLRGNGLHPGEFPLGTLQRQGFLLRAAAGGHRSEQHGGCENLFHHIVISYSPFRAIYTPNAFQQ